MTSRDCLELSLRDISLCRQLEPIHSLFIYCILYFLSRSFQFNSRNLEMNVNSVEVTNFRQILTLWRALIMEMCGLFLVVTSQSTLPICHPRFRFPLRGGERKHFSSVKFMLSKYGRTSCTKNRPKISFVLLVFSLSAIGIPFARY